MSERARGRPSRRVLLAEASATLRAVASRVLGGAGYRVEEATDGGEALARLEGGEAPDVLVLGLELPRASGLDVLRRVRESVRLRSIPVILVGEPQGAHLRRVLADLGVDATFGRGDALGDLLWLVDTLGFPEHANRRRAPRRLRRFPVNYWYQDALHLESCFDLSETGMFVIVSDAPPPPAGARLLLRFWLPTGEHLVGAEGVVRWVNGTDPELHLSHPPGMGVDFTRLEERDRALIRAWLEPPRP